MKHICAQPIMKFYHRKYMLQKKKNRKNKPPSSGWQSSDIQIMQLIQISVCVIIVKI